MNSLIQLLAVGGGGFFGANMRYVITQCVNTSFRSDLIPFGTLFVNVTGSMLLALFSTWFFHQPRTSEHVRLLVGIGFLGAYTTFSTYTNESMVLMQDGKWLQALTYMGISNLICLAGAFAGFWIGTRIWSV